MDTLGRTRVPKTGEIAPTLDREDRYSGAVGPTSLQSAVADKRRRSRSLLKCLHMQDLVEETLGALVLGVLEEVLGGADLDYAALVHEDHPVGYAPREAHLVGDDYHRHTASCEVGHRFEDLVDHLRIQGARRLVEEHYLGFHRQGTSYRDTLLLAAREALGVLVGLLGDAYPLQEA